MVISQLLKDITPDEQLTLTPEGAMKEIEGFAFLGPGWYITDLGSMLVVATDTVNTYIFSIFYGRDPRPSYNAIVYAHVNANTAKTAPTFIQPTNHNTLIYWAGIFVLWIAMLVVGNKWGFRAEIPILLIMCGWIAGTKRWFSKPKEGK